MIVVNEQELLPVTPVQSPRESLRKELQHQIINFFINKVKKHRKSRNPQSEVSEQKDSNTKTFKKNP
jgi:hypothetical protein